MGNETSISEEVGLHTHKTRLYSFDETRNRNQGEAENSDSDEDGEQGIQQQQTHQMFLGPSSRISGGSLKGNLAAVELNEKRKFVDPIMKAAAAGAAARKAKQDRSIRQQQERRIQQQQQQQRAAEEANNEWKISLKRLASAAASTATSVAQVTAPVLKDASSIVVASAKEFAADFHEELKKEEPERQFLNEEESVILYPWSPAGKSWLSSPRYDFSPYSPYSETKRRSHADVISIPPLPYLNQPPKQAVDLFPRGSPPPDETQHTAINLSPSEQLSAVEANLGQRASNERDSTNTLKTIDQEMKLVDDQMDGKKEVLPKQKCDKASNGVPEGVTIETIGMSNNDMMATEQQEMGRTISDGLVVYDSFGGEGAKETKSDGRSSNLMEHAHDTPVYPSVANAMGISFRIFEAENNVDLPLYPTVATAMGILGGKVTVGTCEKDYKTMINCPLYPSVANAMLISFREAYKGVANANLENTLTSVTHPPPVAAQVTKVPSTSAAKKSDEAIHVANPDILGLTLDDKNQKSTAGEPRTQLNEKQLRAMKQLDGWLNPEAQRILEEAERMNFETNEQSRTNLRIEAIVTDPTPPPESLTKKETLLADRTQEKKESENFEDQDLEKQATEAVHQHEPNFQDGGSISKKSWKVPAFTLPEGGVDEVLQKRNDESDSPEAETCRTDKTKTEDNKRDKKLSADQLAGDRSSIGFNPRHQLLRSGPQSISSLGDALAKPNQQSKHMHSSEDESTPENQVEQSAVAFPSNNTEDYEMKMLDEHSGNENDRPSLVRSGPHAISSLVDALMEHTNEPKQSNGSENELSDTLIDSNSVQSKEKRIYSTNDALFVADDDAIYESDASLTPKKQGAFLLKGQDGSKPIAPVSTINRSKVFDHAHALFDNPKSLVDYVVKKLSRYEFKTDNRIETTDFVDIIGHKPITVPESVFLQERKKRSFCSLSPPGSPPEVPFITSPGQEDDGRSVDSVTNKEATLWDLFPEKHNVGASGGSSNLEIERIKEVAPKPKANAKKQYTPLDKDPKTRSESTSLNDSADSFNQVNGAGDSFSFLSAPVSKRQNRRTSKVGVEHNTKMLRKSHSEGNIHVLCGKDNESSQRISDINDERKVESESLIVGWDTDAAAKFPSVPDTEDMTEVFEHEDLLDEALLAFSSLEDVRFLRKVPQSTSPPLKEHASLIWHQLISRWKHSEIWKALIARPCSLHFRVVEGEQVFSEDADSISSSSTIEFQFHNPTIKLPSDRHLSVTDTFSIMKNLSGLKPHSDCEFIVLTGFICDVGPKGYLGFQKQESEEDPLPRLQHKLCIDSSVSEGGNSSVTDLLKKAEAHLADFSNIVQEMVNFASQNVWVNEYGEPSKVNYSVGLKNYTAIRRKAERKYHGDILQVKDVLRGQITFPDEGSLICGLYHLTNLVNGSNSKQTRKEDPRLEILRLKNLFRTSNVGNSYYPPLPTGYRHILVNIRLNDSIIAGKDHPDLFCQTEHASS